MMEVKELLQEEENRWKIVQKKYDKMCVLIECSII